MRRGLGNLSSPTAVVIASPTELPSVNRLIRKLPSALLLPMVIASCGGSSTQTVSFEIPISAGSFSAQATLRVTVWNAEQLRVSQQTADCAVSHDAQTGLDQVSCPPGVVYQQAHPEEFTFSAASSGSSLRVTTTSLHVGEDYAISISGLSQDNCNNASARVEGRARSAIIILENLSWMTTLMACP